MTNSYDALDLIVQAPPFQTWDVGTPWPWFLGPHCIGPMVLTSGGHHSMYGWQAGGTHPTIMLSFYNVIVIRLFNFTCFCPLCRNVD